MSEPIDAAVRLRALHPQTSFIVQAPAGSGKTELLTRRILTLLVTVEEPEEILAITFTRKAASEMRQRVVETLERAASGVAAANEYEAEGLVLAKQVLERDRSKNWQLIINSQRLNLRTIDSLATQLAHRLPVTSALGAPTGVTESAYVLYREVASRFIDGHIHAIPRILLQLGNRLERAQSLFADLLANRDQWKRHVYAAGDNHDQLRKILESMLAELVESRMANLLACVPPELEALPERLRVAFEFLLQDKEGDVDELSFEIQTWADLHELPGAGLEDLYSWSGIGVALLTTDFKVRKTCDKRIGFPAATDAKKRGVDKAVLVNHKDQMLALLEATRESPEFVEALVEVSSLPYPRYADEQWELLSELLSVLPSLLFELQLVFSERRQVDFAEVSERAQWALGPEDAPTDLALAMDLALKHVLVDEFQDTSQTQFRLFEQLVRGWSVEDGRTFFVVGDPMQSIYRFREGDVALFGQVQENGIGTIALEPLTLSVNFRAAPTIVGWVNDSFGRVFPQRADPDSGAIPYSASNAHLQVPGNVSIHALVGREKIEEAERVAELVKAAIDTGPEHTVAILLRTRGQAVEIFAALRSAGIEYESVDMDLVGERPVVRDLLSLCLALRYPHDRLHWLALLRAPFVGLTLNDLYALMNEGGPQASVIELLRQPERVSTLSREGQTRIEHFLPIIESALTNVNRGSLMPWVESVWLQLGGPAVCKSEVDANAAEQAISTLVRLEADGRLWQQSALSDAMASLYAKSANADCQVQIMTLHKAKGLEFDTVILPALDRQPRRDGTQLLNWFESTLDGQPQLLLAPFEQSGLHPGQRDKINRLVRKARERCDEQEKLRLLYVACTRAKSSLHLVARAATDTAGLLRQPIGSSLLSPLWPLLESEFASAPATAAAQLPVGGQEQIGLDLQEESQPPLFERLPLGAKIPPMDTFECVSRSDIIDEEAETVEFRWAGRDARDIGTVVHLQLQRLVQNPDELANPDMDSMLRVVRRQLQEQGVPLHKIEGAAQRVMGAIHNTLADERGQWVLAAHTQGHSEWALSVPLVGGAKNPATTTLAADASSATGVLNVVIDRSFVDERGVRWIVDFKTGDHSGGQVDVFLNSEQSRYAGQLDRYADIMRRIEQRPIRVGLYFPMLKGWREWEPPFNRPEE